jgi:hypothetical protein
MTLSNLLMTAYVNKASEAGKGVFDILEEVAREHLTDELYEQAAGLFDPNTTLRPSFNEYARGIVELVQRFTGSDDKDDVASIISERTNTGYLLTAADFGTGINGDLLYIGPYNDAIDFIREHDNTVTVERKIETGKWRVELSDGNSFGVADTCEMAWRYAIAAEFGPIDDGFVPFRLK